MKKFMIASSVSALALTLALPAAAQVAETVDTPAYQISVETIVDGLDHPWALAFIDEERFIVTERDTGQIRIATVEGDLKDPSSVKLGINAAEAEFVVMQALMFPGINILWAGCVLLALGTGMAVWQRIRGTGKPKA